MVDSDMQDNVLNGHSMLFKKQNKKSEVQGIIQEHNVTFWQLLRKMRISIPLYSSQSIGSLADVTFVSRK
jgi:hypothetical protein